MTLSADSLRQQLLDRLAPRWLEVIDESAAHAGHAHHDSHAEAGDAGLDVAPFHGCFLRAMLELPRRHEGRCITIGLHHPFRLGMMRAGPFLVRVGMTFHATRRADIIGIEVGRRECAWRHPPTGNKSQAIRRDQHDRPHRHSLRNRQPA